MLPAILICAFMVKNIATQNVTATLGATKSCVLIGDDVKLLCTVSSGCCSSSSRKWQKAGVTSSLLNNGVSSDLSKYVEDYVLGTTTGFNLIIKNVQTSDFGVNYKCQYGLTPSNELYLNNILCNCWECAGKDYGWSILGTVIGTVIILIIAKVKIGDLKTVLKVGGLTFIISAVVNIPFALLFGYLMCHCVNGTDWLLIITGLVTSGITGVIALLYTLKQGGVESCRTLSVLFKVPTVKVHVVTTGNDVILECTVTSCLPINSVQWERNVGGSTMAIDTNINKYSGGTATTPSLTIRMAESSDEGTYRCFASNCVGTGQSTTITIVPTVKVPRSSYVVTTGKAMILECTVTSCLPITSVQWKRNGGSITTVNSNTNHNKYSGSTATTPSLTICKAASSDEGTYICFASNCVGTGQSTTITVAKQDPASGKKSKQDGDQELNEKEEKSQLLIK